MKKKKALQLAFCLVALTALPATAGITAVRHVCKDSLPAIEVTYDVPDAGRPGLVWVGVTTPTNWSAYFLQLDDWIEYKGGIYQSYRDYRTMGLPDSLTVVIPTGTIPKGWRINIGYGLTPGDAKLTQLASITSKMDLNAAEVRLAQREMIQSERFERASVVEENACTLNKNLAASTKI